MASVTLKGNNVALKGDIPTSGKAPDFTFVKDNLSEAKLSDFAGKKKVIMAVPSLDTGICAMQTKRFNQDPEGMSDVVGLVVSMDLPFAMKRFCETEGLKTVINASDFRYKEFVNKYNTELQDSGLKGVSARAIWVLDGDDNIKYSELVPEITQEPNYEDALAALKAL